MRRNISPTGPPSSTPLLLSKIILLGEYLRLGKRQEHKPLIHSTIYKSFTFTRLVGIFHILEDAVKGVLDGEGIVGSFDALSGRGKGEMLVHSLTRALTKAVP